jgi:signal peptidase I
MRTGGFFGTTATFFDLTKYLILAVVIIATLFVLVSVPLFIQGVSMEPNFQNGELVVIEKLSYMNGKPIRRGDVVAAVFPGDPKRTRLIKRVVGLPGESVGVNDGRLTINGAVLNEPYSPRLGAPPYQELAKTLLKADEYFLVGDNRPGSSDSRLWGAVARADIQGRASFILWPLDAWRYIDRL